MGVKPKAGDILEVKTPAGHVYLHYLGKHREYGDAVAVGVHRRDHPGTIDAALFHGAYVTFYPATAAAAQGLATVVGHTPSPGVPVKWRRAGAMAGNRVVTWVIEDGTREVVKAELSEDERHIPVASIWNHEFLLKRVAAGWRPENETS